MSTVFRWALGAMKSNLSQRRDLVYWQLKVGMVAGIMRLRNDTIQKPQKMTPKCVILGLESQCGPHALVCIMATE